MRFIRIEGSYVPVVRIREIRPASQERGTPQARFTLDDDDVRTGFFPPELQDALTEELIPAPPGYEALFFEFEGEKTDKIASREQVIAFAYDPVATYLVPVTPQSGRMSTFAVKTPTGQVYTSSETFFETEEEFIKARAEGKIDG
jgi:hypothetical protein